MIQPMTQKILPVVASGNRILGTVILDAETVFDGSETSIMIQGHTYPLTYYAVMRPSDVAAVNYMGINISPTEERQQMQNHLPDFGEVSVNTSTRGWRIPGLQIWEPLVNDSTWEKFLIDLKPQDVSILPTLTPLIDS